MSATVTSILTAGKAQMATTLGATWHELSNVYDLARNNLRAGAKGYGMRPLGADDTDTVTRAYDLIHTFETVLMDTVARQNDDSQAETVIGTLYDKQDEIFKVFARLNINLAGTVIYVARPSLNEPEFVGGGKFVALRQQFQVRYRQSIF